MTRLDSMPAGERPGDAVCPDLAALPRDEGGPVFRAPWEARAFALLVALCDDRRLSLGEFREYLAAEIAAADDGAAGGYYARLLAAVERMLADRGYVSGADLEARLRALTAHRR